MTGIASSGIATAAFTGARHNGSRMPANIALETGRGMRAMSRSRAGHNPTSRMSAAAMMNAATASANLPVTPAVATRSAAPGVLQANFTGTRYTALNAIESRPCTTQITSRPDADWASVAPTAASPASTIANELENPVMAATIPAMIGWTMGYRALS